MNDSLPKRSTIYDQDSEEIHFVEYETAVTGCKGVWPTNTNVFAAVVSLFFFF